MTSLLEYMAKNEDASLSVGQWVPQQIVDVVAARNHRVCNLCTRASFDLSAPRECAIILHSTSYIVVAFIAFGWHLNEVFVFRIDLVNQQPLQDS